MEQKQIQIDSTWNLSNSWHAFNKSSKSKYVPIQTYLRGIGLAHSGPVI